MEDEAPASSSVATTWLPIRRATSTSPRHTPAHACNVFFLRVSAPWKKTRACRGQKADRSMVTVLNLGTATGSLQSVNVSGASYQLAGAPAATAPLQPGQQVSFNVVFTPQAAGSSQGSLSLTLNNGI